MNIRSSTRRMNGQIGEEMAWGIPSTDVNRETQIQIQKNMNTEEGWNIKATVSSGCTESNDSEMDVKLMRDMTATESQLSEEYVRRNHEQEHSWSMRDGSERNTTDEECCGVRHKEMF